MTMPKVESSVASGMNMGAGQEFMRVLLRINSRISCSLHPVREGVSIFILPDGGVTDRAYDVAAGSVSAMHHPGLACPGRQAIPKASHGQRRARC